MLKIRNVYQEEGMSTRKIKAATEKTLERKAERTKKFIVN